MRISDWSSDVCSSDVFVDGVLDEDASELGRVSIGALDLATDHPLGRQATGAGWALTLDRDQATDGIEIVHIASGGANHLPAHLALAEIGRAAWREREWQYV